VSTGLIFDERFLDHDTRPGHPERPERLPAIRRALQDSGCWDRMTHLSFEPVERTRLARLHTRAYLDRLQDACVAGLAYIDTPDSAIGPDSEATARLAVGGVLRAVEAVMGGEVNNAFCAVRPPGHHAERDQSQGFCLYANVALAAEALIADHGCERVAVVDFDVHHGNGTQHLLEERADILFASLHQDPYTCYPGSGFASEIGRGAGEGATLNLPLEPGSGDEAMLAAVDETLLPKLRAFAPQFLLLSAGFDAAAADPLAELNWTTDGFAELTRRLIEAVASPAHGRIVSVLEGGYDLDALGRGVAAHVGALLDSA
jgi:acetoin utilization deacetylase AcuC-like enzyme